MTGSEQIVEELDRIAHLAAGDPLLELPHVAGDRLDVFLLVAGQRGDDRVGQFERSRRAQPTGLDAGEHAAGLAQRDLGSRRPG